VVCDVAAEHPGEVGVVEERDEGGGREVEGGGGVVEPT
jgi:hypothetical protein